VPLGDVRRLEVGFRLSPEDGKAIEEVMGQLGSKRHKEREEAQQRLLEFSRKAYPALLKEVNSKDAEVARRAQALVQHLQQTVPADQLQFQTDDRITTAD